MLLTILVPLLVAIVGFLLFCFAANPKIQKTGEHMLWTGLLCTLLAVGASKIHLP